MSNGRKPQPLASALSELITLRGWARAGGDSRLADAWNAVAGEQAAKQTRVLKLNRGVLHVDVTNAPLLSELVSFHHQDLLERLRVDYPELKIKNLKFRLQGRL